MRSWVILSILLSGCTSFSPLLIPTSKPPSASTSETIQVIVKPIATQGMGSDDEKQWGFEISAYFSAFEVAVQNNTKEEIRFAPAQSYLLVGATEKFQALKEDAAIRYYKAGDDPSRFVLIPKSKKRVEEEIKHIKAAWLTGGSILPNQQKKGLILFKKVKHDQCDRVTLNLEGITLAASGMRKPFSFSFSCKEEERRPNRL